MLIGRSPPMAEVYKAIGRVAGQEVIVLILGESGTGKELVARAIYQHSRRADKPFLAINCAAIPENLLESELFGHERGAFTGADRRRVGKFEQCNGGTLFLDEIGDMALPTQAKMLRVLQEQSVSKAASAARRCRTERLCPSRPPTGDLEGPGRREGRFRPDLYYRLSVFHRERAVHGRVSEEDSDLCTLVQSLSPEFSNRELGKDVHDVLPSRSGRVSGSSSGRGQRPRTMQGHPQAGPCSRPPAPVLVAVLLPEPFPVHHRGRSRDRGRWMTDPLSAACRRNKFIAEADALLKAELVTTSTPRGCVCVVRLVGRSPASFPGDGPL